MGVLNALFLAAAAFGAVPLLLHLFHRQQGARVTFPALRYLERTERDHAHRIRTRQTLLLVLRLAVVGLLVLAGARLYVRGDGSAHPPTALAIVLDNSLSSGVVVGEGRALDRLRDLALEALELATGEDRIWVIRAGEPWAAAFPAGPEEARRRVRETTVVDGASDLPAALARARELVSASPLRHREILLLSDLQATALSGPPSPAGGDLPVVAWAPEAPPTGNRAVGLLVVAGGLPPMVGERSVLTVALHGWGEGARDEVTARLVLDGRVVAVGHGVPGTTVALPLPPAPPGWVLGHVETDPDALRADDRRFFAFRASPAPGVAVSGDAGPFVTEALGALEAGGRIRRAPAPDADLVLAAGAAGLEDLPAGVAVAILAPADPVLLPSVNRRLREAGIPWSLEHDPRTQEAGVEGDGLPPGLEGTRVVHRFALVPTPGADGAGRVLARVGDAPWLVDGTDRHGRRYLLLASPLDSVSTSLPLSAAMIQFTDWLAGAGTAPLPPGRAGTAGRPLPAPRDAEAVRLPSGLEVPLDGSRTVWATGEAGHYAFLAGDSVLAFAAVNPPESESELRPLPASSLQDHVGTGLRVVDDPHRWSREVFTSRRGSELVPLLLGAALLLLFVEGALASSGTWTRPGRRTATGRGEGHGIA